MTVTFSGFAVHFISEKQTKRNIDLAMNSFIKSFAFLILHFSFSVTAQSFNLFVPIFDCSNPNFQATYKACKPQDYTKCCAVGSVCCAGGCCSIAAVCVRVGTSSEACCDYLDDTHCYQVRRFNSHSRHFDGAIRSPLGRENGNEDELLANMADLSSFPLNPQ